MLRRSLSLPALPFLLIVQTYLPAYQGARREEMGSGRNSEHRHHLPQSQRGQRQTGDQRENAHQRFHLTNDFTDRAIGLAADMACFVHGVSGRNEQYQRNDQAEQPGIYPFPSRHVRPLLSFRRVPLRFLRAASLVYRFPGSVDPAFWHDQFLSLRTVLILSYCFFLGNIKIIIIFIFERMKNRHIA